MIKYDRCHYCHEIFHTEDPCGAQFGFLLFCCWTCLERQDKEWKKKKEQQELEDSETWWQKLLRYIRN